MGSFSPSPIRQGQFLSFRFHDSNVFFVLNTVGVRAHHLSLLATLEVASCLYLSVLHLLTTFVDVYRGAALLIKHTAHIKLLLQAPCNHYKVIRMEIINYSIVIQMKL